MRGSRRSGENGNMSRGGTKGRAGGNVVWQVGSSAGIDR